jgi:predicted SAM-dependent methyltransferase
MWGREQVSGISSSTDRSKAGGRLRISVCLPSSVRQMLRPCSRRAWIIAWRIRLQWWKLTRNARLRQLYNTCDMIKVTLGTGTNVRPGWINTDYEPLSKEVLYVDATKRLPFPERFVDYFHTEHMIEHIPLHSTQFILSECYRTLKPGGKIRIATPDIMKLSRLLTDPNALDVVEYTKWALEHVPPKVEDSTPLTPCMVFNNFMRNWGHQFIFDEPTLKGLLIKAGFASVRRCEINESDDPNLANQEMRQVAIGDAANNFETIVIEATKPA